MDWSQISAEHAQSNAPAPITVRKFHLPARNNSNTSPQKAHDRDKPSGGGHSRSNSSPQNGVKGSSPVSNGQAISPPKSAPITTGQGFSPPNVSQQLDLNEVTYAQQNGHYGHPEHQHSRQAEEFREVTAHQPVSLHAIPDDAGTPNNREFDQHVGSFDSDVSIHVPPRKAVPPPSDEAMAKLEARRRVTSIASTLSESNRMYSCPWEYQQQPSESTLMVQQGTTRLFRASSLKHKVDNHGPSPRDSITSQPAREKWASLHPRIVDESAKRNTTLTLHIPPPPRALPPHLQPTGSSSPISPTSTPPTPPPKEQEPPSPQLSIKSAAEPQRGISSEELKARRRATLLPLGALDPEGPAPSPRPPLAGRVYGDPTNLKSFVTPEHLRYDRWKAPVNIITGPQLTSTSSKMKTIPIADLLKDLEAKGKLDPNSLPPSHKGNVGSSMSSSGRVVLGDVKQKLGAVGKKVARIVGTGGRDNLEDDNNLNYGSEQKENFDIPRSRSSWRRSSLEEVRRTWADEEAAYPPTLRSRTSVDDMQQRYRRMDDEFVMPNGLVIPRNDGPLAPKAAGSAALIQAPPIAPPAI
ncbi:hypothetical protein HK102_010671 [Quaeritorhiza haematococci]|nr:hypothetical protein HK102_010671 [Quaeritorhiza haematococci]